MVQGVDHQEWDRIIRCIELPLIHIFKLQLVDYADTHRERF
jgi:hypothetical protein